ncbi:MAG TPA: hypothetical protein VKU00_04740 [Chthonomonadaceae bacterium]|nr:hypothetical protein [Chthonomonadaceae bacterium]
MPVDITLAETRIGYSTGNARAGEKIGIEVGGFYTTEDGYAFIKRLEGLPSQILLLLPTQIRPSQVDHMLVIIRRDKSATVYVNELVFKLDVRFKKFEHLFCLTDDEWEALMSQIEL